MAKKKFVKNIYIILKPGEESSITSPLFPDALDKYHAKLATSLMNGQNLPGGFYVVKIYKMYFGLRHEYRYGKLI